MNKIHPRKILFELLYLILFLLILNVASYLFLLYENGNPEEFYFRKTNFNTEKNLPSVFSSLLHFSSCLLLLQIGLSKKRVLRTKFFWFFLSFFFLFTSLDELLRIHEKVGLAFSEAFETSGIFLFSWVIPYAIGLVMIFLFIMRPLFSLDKVTLRNFIISGSLFLFGAIGVEIFSGWYFEKFQLDLTQLFVLPDAFILSTIEELLEMIAVSYFIYSLLLFKMKHNI